MGQSGKKDLQIFTESFNVAGTAAGTATNYGLFFVAPYPCRVLGVQERHETAGSNGGAVTLMLRKVVSGVAKGTSTQDLLASGINLKGTADIVQTGTLSGTASIDLARGDSLAFVTSGTLTAVAGVCATVTLTKV